MVRRVCVRIPLARVIEVAHNFMGDVDAKGNIDGDYVFFDVEQISKKDLVDNSVNVDVSVA